jgi:hypothetical protein
MYCLDALSQAIKYKALNGLSLFKAMLTRIRMTRKLFVMDVETGLDVRIPSLLSQSHLPYSFRFYDPVFAFIQEGISPEVKQKA